MNQRTGSAPSQGLVGVVWGGAVGVMVLLPALWIGLFGLVLADPARVIELAPHAGLTQPPDTVLIVAAFATHLLPLIIFVWGANALRTLFARYRQGDVFSAGSAMLFRQVGMAAALGVPVSIVAQTLATTLLSLNNEPGARVVALGVSGWQVGLMLGACILLVIAQIMAQAAQLADDNAGFI